MADEERSGRRDERSPIVEGRGPRPAPQKAGPVVPPAVAVPSMLASVASRLPAGVLQRKLAARIARRALHQASEPGAALDGETAARAAETGIASSTSPVPHLSTLQPLFGRHDLSAVQAHHGAEATRSAEAMGAEAYATGDHAVFAGTPSLHTAAHEMAHVVQQRAGLHLAGGVGQDGDPHELHADAVADAVVRGQPVEALLDQVSPAAPASDAGGGPAPVQHKNLTQAGLADGLKLGGSRALVGDPRKVLLYAVDVPEVATDRIAAISKAAEINAGVGKRIEGLSFTPETGPLNDARTATLDPFMLGIGVKHKDGGGDHELKIIYQHAARFTGYVEAIRDTSHPEAKDWATMHDHDTGPRRPSDKYSNIHESKDNSTKIANMTDEQGEDALDAYTKLGGEGARWQCVRAHMYGLRNDSLFFCAHPTEKDKVRAVTFRKLWLSWKDAFSKKYDIPDEEVVKALLTGGLAAKAETWERKNLGRVDYDLDAHRAHDPK